MNQTVLSYSGDVTINLTILGKTFEIYGKNAGSYYLMKCFAKMLTGHHATDGTEEPKFLLLECLDMNNFPDGYIPQESDWKSFLRAIVPLTESTYLPEQDNSYIKPYASFIAMLTADNMIDTVEYDPKKSYRFVLCSGYDEKIASYNALATLIVDLLTLMKISPGTLATINWIMRVLNQEQTIGA